ncbi:Rv3654c family TadE-like protein [Streptomyces sp. NPDC052225]|uniref:Rv3654c family TadE-like protein n=1 Tax=Streptomyces sp. NPDC052225 TaxID=3154949 RepID=UPI00343F38EE
MSGGSGRSGRSGRRPGRAAVRAWTAWRAALRARADRGSATVWAVVALAAVGVVFGGVLAFGQAVQARHRAGGAADLAALAAADHWMEGRADACALARRVARAQGARVVRCSVYGEVSDVTAAAGTGAFAAQVRARAGPAGPVPPGPAPRGP